MKSIAGLIIAMLSIFLNASLQAAGDAAAGQAKAVLCAACHGPEGISSNETWPNLRGQQRRYLVKQIKAFRDGSRKNRAMQPMVASLSDEDIDNLAAYYSSMK